MRVLGIDPGYAIVGWGVLDYAGNRFAPVDFGAVCTDAGVPFEQRLDEVYTGIREVIERTQPEVCLLYTSPSPRDRTRSRMPSSA